MDGSSGMTSQQVNQFGTNTMSRGPSPRRPIGDAQVPVHRVARLREHGGSVSRGAGRAVRVGNVYAAHERFLEVFFSQSVPPPAQNILGLARPPTPRRHGGVDLTARTELHHPSGQPAVVPAPVPAHRSGHRPRHTGRRPGHAETTGRGLMMPRRKQTRAQQRANTSPTNAASTNPWAAERIAERNKPPPF